MTAPAADPILGFWRYKSGVIGVSRAPDGFIGTVRREITLVQCPHKVGEVMWKITRSGGDYTGTHLGWTQWDDCDAERVPQTAQWSISGEAGDTLKVHVTSGDTVRDYDFQREPSQAVPVGPGDHVWYWFDNSTQTPHTSQAAGIPRLEWFPNADPNDSTDYQGHGKEIFEYTFLGNEIRRGQPHMKKFPGTYAWLDNNPGNLTGVQNGTDFGQYNNKFNWHNFLIFPSFDVGYAAIAAFLRQDRWKNLTILQAFRDYAPAEDGNDPDSYATSVAEEAGVTTDTLVGDLTDDQMAAVQAKITQIEDSRAGDTYRYDSADLPAAIKQLLPSSQ
ncbi:hypothetical protein [Nocardia sp. NPDC004604]|uniref:hypothetical protein n=1 Tax=Nocardia sp. NPDC004604 TaxID=3157013 RepID=UPI0033A73836